jgi:hypothetical protein
MQNLLMLEMQYFIFPAFQFHSDIFENPIINEEFSSCNNLSAHTASIVSKLKPDLKLL